MVAISATTWILQATLAETLMQASSEVGSRARVGSAYIVGGWHTVSLK